MGVLTAAARASAKAGKAAKKATQKVKRKSKKVENIDSLVKEQVAKAKAAKAKREANEKLGEKAKAKTKKKDSGDISEVLMPEDRPSRDTEKQTSEERFKNATGNISAMLTSAGLKPLSMDVYRSFTSANRAAIKRKAGQNLRAKKITQSTYNTIVDRIDAANEVELMKNVRSMEQGIANKKSKPVTLDKSMGISEKDMPRKPIRLKKGGMAKKRMAYKAGGYVNCGASVPGTQKGKK